MRRIPLAAEVEKQLSDLIQTKYSPGSKIPIESELSEMFQVSRTTIRAAVKALCSRNVLEIKRGDGTYVTRKPGLGPDALGLEFLDPTHLPEEMREASILLQPVAAAMGAQRIDDRDIAFLEDAITALEQGVKDYQAGKIDYPALRWLDSSFHSSVIKTCHNRVLDRIDDVFITYTATMREREIVDMEIIYRSLEMHPQIFRAMRNHDSQAAYEAMSRHLHSVPLRYKEPEE